MSWITIWLLIGLLLHLIVLGRRLYEWGYRKGVEDAK